ncbi:phospholipase D-like domain-containing protein [Chlamydia pecorum]|uniref:phospholipase D-like domain-containing protein n=2 Tax=Chlamydia pecorum TaxID=85991 RepID=UPI003524EF4E
MLCAHGPNALAVGISRLSLGTIECSKKTSNLNPSAKEFIPRFTMSHPYVPPPPQSEGVSAGRGDASCPVEGAGYSSLGARPKVRKQSPEESVVPQSLVYKALNIPGSPHCLEEGVQFFSKDCGDNIEDIILSAIRSASSEIKVKIYHLSSESIMRALRERADNGLNVSVHYQLLRDNAKVFSDASHMKLQLNTKSHRSFQHKKEIIIDDSVAIIGTMNFSNVSIHSDANCLIKIHSPRLCYFMKRNISGKCYVQGQEIIYYSLYRNGPDASEEIVHAIDKAKKEIRVAVFIFSQVSILEALDRAHRRGVKVTIIVDSVQRLTTFLELQKLNSQIELLECLECGCLHCKMCVIDENLIVGSANWTKRGFTGNTENILMIKGMTPSQKESVNRFWEYLFSHSHKVTMENVYIKRKRVHLQDDLEEED